MQFKHLAVAAAIAALGSSPVWANNVTVDVPLSGDNAVFSAVHTDNQSFTDTFTFDVSGQVLADLSAVTIALSPYQNIDFTSATLNGDALQLYSVAGGTMEGFFAPALPYTGPLTLVVNGNSSAGMGYNASYAGTLNIVPVPEPETYALLLAGLGAIGFVARRRKQS
jgi:hypothetical protein